MASQSMVQGRLQFDAINIPVAVGGVQVRPGDVIVADGDGVIAVPQEIALDVAREAHAEKKRDMKNRRKLYELLGRKPDHTVAQEES
jgi:regulator of RNase E activity RraA